LDVKDEREDDRANSYPAKCVAMDRAMRIEAWRGADRPGRTRRMAASAKVVATAEDGEDDDDDDDDDGPRMYAGRRKDAAGE